MQVTWTTVDLSTARFDSLNPDAAKLLFDSVTGETGHLNDVSRVET